MAKRNKKFDFVNMFLKKNNVKHESTPRIVATTNKNDRAFLGDNVISTTENA